MVNNRDLPKNMVQLLYFFGRTEFGGRKGVAVGTEGEGI